MMKRKTTHNGVRTLHQITSLACICGAIYGSWNSWLKYQSEPLSSTTTEVATDRHTAPSLTVCHYDYTTYTKNRKSVSGVELAELEEEFDAMQLVMGFQGTNSTSALRFGVESSELSILPPSGNGRNLVLCRTFNPETGLGPIDKFGALFNVQFRPNETHYLHVKLHERGALTLTGSDLLGTTSKLIEIHPKADDTTSQFLTFHYVQSTQERYPQKSRPACNTKRSNSEIDVYGCLLAKAEAASGCELDLSRSNGENLTQCSEFTRFMRAALAGYGWQERDLPQAGCIPSCTRESFEITEVIDSTMNNGVMRLSLPESIRNTSFNLNVGIYSTQGTKSLTQEAVIFNGFDLTASIGGYLGLFLGASIISIYHSGFAIGRKMMQRQQRLCTV